MEFFIEATRDDSSLSRLPVLLFEPRRDKMNEFVFVPGYISFQEVSEDDDKDVDQPQIIQIWHCIKSENSKAVEEWSYDISCIRSLSRNKRDSRGLFLYVVDKYCEDFQVFFSSKEPCKRFHDMIHVPSQGRGAAPLVRFVCRMAVE